MYEIKDRVPNFDLHPVFTIPNTNAWKGTEQISKVLMETIEERLHTKKRFVIIFDYYHGINEDKIKKEVIDRLPWNTLVDSNDIKITEEEVWERFGQFITNDRINGVFSFCKIDEFFDQTKKISLKKKLDETTGIIVLFGVGAATLYPYDMLVYGNVTIQKVKDGYVHGLPNWGANNAEEDPLTKEKRFNFLESRIEDAHKRELMEHMDFVIDGDGDEFVMISGDDYRTTLSSFANRPFKLEPFFNRGIWGGHWCKDVLNGGLDKDNTAWGMTGWMNAQNALAQCGDHEFHVAGRDIISYAPIDFLGNQIFYWFGYNCPVGCDFLDTWGGGNLSLQVHPDNAYGQAVFNAQFGHYESYYMLDTCEDSTVYLGTKEGVEKNALVEALCEAQETGTFDDEKWINCLPMKKHDHIFIPSGTIHASGKNTLVLEINPIGFQTFKLWDWGRIDADGKPRPIHIDHGAKVIQERFQTSFVKQHLISKKSEVARGDGWRKEHSGTMEYELLQVDRYWFSKPIFFETKDHVKLHVLVEGEEALLYSPNDEFEPIHLHYAEAIFVPASVGQYIIKPFGKSLGEELAVLECYMDLGDAY